MMISTEKPQVDGNFWKGIRWCFLIILATGAMITLATYAASALTNALTATGLIR